MKKQAIIIREMSGSDGARIAFLAAESPDEGRLSFYPHFMIDPIEGISALYQNVVGAVAYDADADRIVGMGIVDFGACHLNGELIPYAHISRLRIHPGYRRRGVGRSIVNWLIDYGRKEAGSEGVALASIQNHNRSTLAAMREFLPVRAAICRRALMRTTRRRVRECPGLEVVEAGERELMLLTDHCNEFYRDHDFYQPASVAAWSRLLWHNPAGPLWKCMYVRDRAGKILAGALLLEEYRVRHYHLHRVPLLMTLSNTIFRFLPDDRMLKQLWIDRLWFAPEGEKAAAYLVDWVRHAWYGKANAVLCCHDVKSPLSRVLPIPFWHPQPRVTVLADRAPAGGKMGIVFPIM